MVTVFICILTFMYIIWQVTPSDPGGVSGLNQSGMMSPHPSSYNSSKCRFCLANSGYCKLANLVYYWTAKEKMVIYTINQDFSTISSSTRPRIAVTIVHSLPELPHLPFRYFEPLLEGTLILLIWNTSCINSFVSIVPLHASSHVTDSALSVPEVSSTVPLSNSPTISSSSGNPTKEQRPSQSASRKASTSSMKVEPKETAKSSKGQSEVTIDMAYSLHYSANMSVTQLVGTVVSNFEGLCLGLNNHPINQYSCFSAFLLLGLPVIGIVIRSQDAVWDFDPLDSSYLMNICIACTQQRWWTSI